MIPYLDEWETLRGSNAGNPRIDSIILAGGLGTRLRSIVQDLPKPMASVGGRPFLEYLVLQLRRNGLRRVVLAVGYKVDVIQRYFRNGSQWDVEIVYSVENCPMGTGGALHFALVSTRTDDLLVLNGDSYFDIDLRGLVRFHQSVDADVSIALAEVRDATRYGTVAIDASNRVCGFREKQGQGRRLVNGGIYVLKRRLVEEIPAGRKISLEREIFPVWTGRRMYGKLFQTKLYDIGTPESYDQVCRDPSVLLGSKWED